MCSGLGFFRWEFSSSLHWSIFCNESFSSNSLCVFFGDLVMMYFVWFSLFGPTYISLDPLTLWLCRFFQFWNIWAIVFLLFLSLYPFLAFYYSLLHICLHITESLDLFFNFCFSLCCFVLFAFLLSVLQFGGFLSLHSLVFYNVLSAAKFIKWCFYFRDFFLSSSSIWFFKKHCFTSHYFPITF